MCVLFEYEFRKNEQIGKAFLNLKEGESLEILIDGYLVVIKMLANKVKFNEVAYFEKVGDSKWEEYTGWASEWWGERLAEMDEDLYHYKMNGESIIFEVSEFEFAFGDLGDEDTWC